MSKVKMKTSNLFDFKNVDQLKRFVEQVKSLRQLVMCHICLELIQKPVRIACNHIFCSNCLDTFINTFKDQAPNQVPQCPVCRTAINRQRNSINSYIESLLEFLREVDATTCSEFGCSILDLAVNKDISKLFKQKISAYSSSSVIESTSYADPFDILLNSKSEFKGKGLKTYSRCVKKDTQVEEKNKSCVNSDSVSKIQQWLKDTKNCFDRITQTQFNETISVEPSLNMPSVSQLSSRQTRKKNDVKRVRSFEFKQKSPIKKVKRHSITGESQGMENEVVIEEIDTEEIEKEKELIRQLEEKCLNSIDLEWGIGQKSEQKLKELKSSNTSVDKNSWKRLNKINKTINKNSRKKKELDVTLTGPIGKENIANNTRNKKKAKINVTLPENNKDINCNKSMVTKRCENVNNNDFICNATKLTKNRYKLKNWYVTSNDQYPNTSNAESETRTAEPKSLNTTIIDDSLQIMKKLNIALQTESDINKSSLSELKTTLNDLNNILNGDKNKLIAASTQTNCEMKSVLVQTEIEETKKDYDKNKLIVASTQTNFEMKSVLIQTEIEEDVEKTTSQNIKSQKSKTTSLKSTVFLSSDAIKKLTEQLDAEDEFFKTQEMIPSENTSGKIDTSPLVPTQKINDKEKDDELNKIENVECEEIGSLRSQLLVTLSNKRINSKEECEERIAQVSKRYKRIRDFDCDAENLVKKSKMENKYLADDLSIEMMSENIVDDNLNTDINFTPSLNNCKNVDYDSYLVNIMKKYENNPSTNEKEPRSSKKTESQIILDRCDAMIKEITSVRKNDEKPKENLEILENKEGDEIDDLAVRESPIDTDVLEEFDEPFDQQFDNLPNTESYMANIDIQELKNSSNLNGTVEGVHIPSNDMKEIKDNEEIELEKEPNVIILKNVLLDTKTKEGEENNVNNNVGSEDLFNSENDEPIDEDVIETTPTKQLQNIQRSFSSKPKLVVNKLLPLPPPINSPECISSIDPISFLKKTFTPPEDFQDENNVENNTSAINHIMINCDDFDDTIVPPNSFANKKNNFATRGKSNQTAIDLDMINTKDFDDTMCLSDNSNKTAIENNVDLGFTESELIRVINREKDNNVITSTQKTFSNKYFESPKVSPIQKKRRLNPIEIAQGAKYSPLTVISSTKPESSKPRHVTPSVTKQRTILSFVKSDKIDKNDSIISIGSSSLSPSPTRKPYVSCTRLNKEQMVSISALSSKKLIHYTNTFSSYVTHIVVSVDNKNCLQDHTMKVLMAIANGRWVVGFDWVKDCLAQNRIVAEEEYEALDLSGLPGPKISRLKGKEKPLLKGYNIHLQPPFLSACKQDIEELITSLGGKIIENIESLRKVDGIPIIITEAKSTQDYFKCEQWLETYKVVAVDIEWLSRSIGQYQVVSIRPFALCSEDNIENLGYPPELTVDVSFSHSQ